MFTEAQMCLRVDVQKALAGLSEEERQVVWGTVVGGMTLDELGAALGCSRDRCFRASKRAVASLHRRLRPYRVPGGRPGQGRGEETRAKPR